jgi:hypothetical protein
MRLIAETHTMRDIAQAFRPNGDMPYGPRGESAEPIKAGSHPEIFPAQQREADSV